MVMWARGVLAVPGAAPIIVPVRPVRFCLSTAADRYLLVGNVVPWDARKQASEAPAGPHPITRKSVSMMPFSCSPAVGPPFMAMVAEV